MSQRRLLVIEDDRQTREAIQRLFISRAWEVVMVETLAEGVAILADYDAHWIIMASDLPDGPCDPFVTRLRSTRRETRIAVVTMAKDTVRLAELAAAQPDLVLPLPVDPEAIYEACNGGSAATG